MLDMLVRPARNVWASLFLCNLSTIGESHVEKIARLRAGLKEKNQRAMVVNMLDEVAWLFNLRGSDIDFNPGLHIFSRVRARCLIPKLSVLCVRHRDIGQDPALRQSTAG